MTSRTPGIAHQLVHSIRSLGCLDLCLFGLIALVALTTGCRDRRDEDEKTRSLFADYGHLTHVSESHHPDLQQEMARLAAEKALPMDLLAESPPPPQREDLGQTMGELLESPLKRRQLDRKLEALMPLGKFDFAPIKLEQAMQAVQANHALHAKLRRTLDRRNARFYVDYQLGMMADLTFVDIARIAARLEAFSAAKSLHENRPADASQSLIYMFRITKRLSEVKHLIPRLMAAQLRQECLLVLEAIVQHPQATRGTLRLMMDLVSSQLASWPPEQNCWIGDRAVGLHVYELVRDGQYLSIISEEKAFKLKKAGMHIIKARAIHRHVDHDQWYYLKTMRRLIQLCKVPYYQRKTELDEIYSQLTATHDSSEYPTIAIEMLLEDIDAAQQQLAADRARCECWCLALAAALGDTIPNYRVNPHNGKPYVIEREQTRVKVSGLDVALDGRPAIVPTRPASP